MADSFVHIKGTDEFHDFIDSRRLKKKECEEVRAFSCCLTSKTITYQFSIGFINVYRSRKAIFYFQDL